MKLRRMHAYEVLDDVAVCGIVEREFNGEWWALPHGGYEAAWWEGPFGSRKEAVNFLLQNQDQP